MRQPAIMTRMNAQIARPYLLTDPEIVKRSWQNVVEMMKIKAKANAPATANR